MGAFREMIEFDHHMNSVQVIDQGVNKTIDELCFDRFLDPNRNKSICKSTAKPIDLIYNYDLNEYDLSKFRDNNELIIEI